MRSAVEAKCKQLVTPGMAVDMPQERYSRGLLCNGFATKANPYVCCEDVSSLHSDILYDVSFNHYGSLQWVPHKSRH